MNKIKKRFCLLLFSSFFILTGCTDTFNYGSNPGSGNGQIVRGPTGVGSGGGVIIVEKNGLPLANAKYDLYIQDGPFKEKLQNGTTDGSGKIQLAGSKLNIDKVKQLQNGSIKIIVEVYDGNVKTAVGGKIIINEGDDEIDFG
jgi:hypothetical protein